jgi:hypothetical protein
MTISVPEDFVEELKASVSSGNISRFLVEGGREKLERERRERALRDLASLPPAFPDITDSAKYIHELRRKEDAHRSSKLGL